MLLSESPSERITIYTNILKDQRKLAIYEKERLHNLFSKLTWQRILHPRPHTRAQLLMSLGSVLKEEITHFSHLATSKNIFQKFFFWTLKFLLFWEKWRWKCLSLNIFLNVREWKERRAISESFSLAYFCLNYTLLYFLSTYIRLPCDVAKYIWGLYHNLVPSGLLKSGKKLEVIFSYYGHSASSQPVLITRTTGQNWTLPASSCKTIQI